MFPNFGKSTALNDTTATELDGASFTFAGHRLIYGTGQSLAVGTYCQLPLFQPSVMGIRHGNYAPTLVESSYVMGGDPI